MKEHEEVFEGYNKWKTSATKAFTIKTIAVSDFFEWVIKSYFMPYSGKDISILDVGAGSKTLKKYLQYCDFKGEYKSLDIDDSLLHDYRTFEEVNVQFDYVCMFELIEHLTISKTLKYLQTLRKIIKKNGILLISTPNIFHPIHFWQDPTHIQAYPINFIYAFLALNNYINIQLYKIELKSEKKLTPYQIMRQILKRKVGNLLGFDYSEKIFAACQNGSK